MQNVIHPSTKHQFLTKTAAKLAHTCGATLFSMSFNTLQVVCQQHFSFLWAIYMRKFIQKWKRVVPKEINQVQFTFTTGQFKTAKKSMRSMTSVPPQKKKQNKNNTVYFHICTSTSQIIKATSCTVQLFLVPSGCLVLNTVLICGAGQNRTNINLIT